MVKQETITIGNRTLVRTWSDSGKYIIQIITGVKYAEAIDIPNKHSYIESSELIPIKDGDVNGGQTKED